MQIASLQLQYAPASTESPNGSTLISAATQSCSQLPEDVFSIYEIMIDRESDVVNNTSYKMH